MAGSRTMRAHEHEYRKGKFPLTTSSKIEESKQIPNSQKSQKNQNSKKSKKNLRINARCTIQRAFALLKNKFPRMRKLDVQEMENDATK